MQTDSAVRAGKRSYIPTLDGWRAIAISLVIGMHCRPALLNSGTMVGRKAAEILMHTAYGVDIFFALSGYLICTLLLQEQTRTGEINLQKFYIRRVFRIMPPMLAYLGMLLLLRYRGILPDIPNAEIVSVLAFVRNYFPTEGVWWYTDHFWSLAIEEHFYLVIPFVLALLKWRTALTTMIGLAVASVMIRALEFHYLSGSATPIQFRTESRVDALMYGAVLAVLLHQVSIRPTLGRWLSPGVVAGIVVSASAIILLWSSVPGRRTVLALTIPLCIVCTVLHPDTIFGRFLELAPVRWIGRLSYSLYVWQMLFFVPEARPLGWFQTFPQALVLALGCAAMSYYLLEKPLIRIGHRLAASPGNLRQANPPEEQATFAPYMPPNQLGVARCPIHDDVS